MKRLTLLPLLTLLLLFGEYAARADSTAIGDDNHQTVQSVLSDIRQSQGVDSNDKIDCDKITDQQFEQLGEAVMDVAHPNPKEHAFMDRMMGGDNSQSLAAMHRLMGANYLGCYKGGTMGNFGFGGMMGGYYGGQPYGPGGHMYGNNGWGMMGSWAGGLIMWLLILIIIVLVVYVLARSRRINHTGSTESPLDILRKRYARGEITKDQFEQMKKDLTG